MARRQRERDREAEARLAAWQLPTTLRLGTADDLEALERLAELDCKRLPQGPHLIGERNGRIDAALSLPTGEMVADPFHPTAGLCDLLRCHAGGLGVTRRHAPAPRLRPRPLPAAT